MANTRASGTARETSICDKCNRVAKPHACNSSRRAEHFAHAWSAFRTLVPDNHHIAGLDFSIHDSLHTGFFSIKHPGRSLHFHHRAFYRGLFHNSPAWSEVSL